MKKEKATQFCFCEPYKHVLPKNLLSPRGKRHKRLWKRIAKPVGSQSKAAWQLIAGTYSSQIFFLFSSKPSSRRWTKKCRIFKSMILWANICLLNFNTYCSRQQFVNLSKGGLWEKEYPWVQNCKVLFTMERPWWTVGAESLHPYWEALGWHKPLTSQLQSSTISRG